MDDQQIEKIHIEKTLKAFSYNVLGVIFPFILSLLPILILRQYAAIWSFLDEGDFFLFSAGLFTTSIFLFSENNPSINEKSDKLLSNLSLWLLIICSAFYAIIYCLNIVNRDDLKLDLRFIRCSSLILFSIAVYSVYRSLFIDQLRIYANVDVKKSSKEGVDEILKNL